MVRHPFLEQGWPACRFTEPNENFAHQHQDVRVENGVQFGDLPEFVDFDYVARVAGVNAAWMWSASQAPGLPQDVTIDTSVLTNDTKIDWTHGDDARWPATRSSGGRRSTRSGRT